MRIKSMLITFFTCTKRGETSCRFGIPYWPMMETRVLLPLPKDDGRKNGLQTRATQLLQVVRRKELRDARRVSS
ncbi:hypothetical protein TNCV_3393301 [Trichonephila clavipes]|nr:hypothetical protein TNCV_3393301 [Trichonephila clavipes]